MLIFKTAFWFMIAFVLGGLACEVEGPGDRALRPFFGGRPVTLYHGFMFSLVTLICHAGYAQGLTMTWTNECRILAMLCLLCATWDFLGFVLSPAYVAGNSRREKVIAYAAAFVLSLAFSSLGWISADATIFDVVDGVMGYFLWMFFVGLAVEFGGDYRRWRGKKKNWTFERSRE